MGDIKKTSISASMQEMVEWARLTGADSDANTIRALFKLADEAPALGPQPTTRRSNHGGFVDVAVLARVTAKAQQARVGLGDYLREIARRELARLTDWTQAEQIDRLKAELNEEANDEGAHSTFQNPPAGLIDGDV